MEKYKLITELSPDECEKVFELNSKLRDDILEDMLQNANFWVSEYLSCWESGISYSIGGDSGDYFAVEYRDYFIDGLKKAQSDYGLLPDDTAPLIDKAALLLDRLDYVDWKGDEKNYHRIDARLNEIVEDLRRLTAQRLKEEYSSCYESNYQLDYFLDFYKEERLSPDCYIDKDYILYQPISFVKCFK